MSLPSIQALEAAFPGQGKELRGILDGTIDPRSYPPVAAWAASCYTPPRRLDLQLEAINAALETSGIEALWGESVTHPVAVYANAGDTYATTLLYCYPTNTWRITSYGDFVERNERRYGLR